MMVRLKINDALLRNTFRKVKLGGLIYALIFQNYDVQQNLNHEMTKNENNKILTTMSYKDNKAQLLNLWGYNP